MKSQADMALKRLSLCTPVPRQVYKGPPTCVTSPPLVDDVSLCMLPRGRLASDPDDPLAPILPRCTADREHRCAPAMGGSFDRRCVEFVANDDVDVFFDDT